MNITPAKWSSAKKEQYLSRGGRQRELPVTSRMIYSRVDVLTCPGWRQAKKYMDVVVGMLSLKKHISHDVIRKRYFSGRRTGLEVWSV